MSHDQSCHQVMLLHPLHKHATSGGNHWVKSWKNHCRACRRPTFSVPIYPPYRHEERGKGWGRAGRRVRAATVGHADRYAQAAVPAYWRTFWMFLTSAESQQVCGAAPVLYHANNVEHGGPYTRTVDEDWQRGRRKPMQRSAKRKEINNGAAQRSAQEGP